MSQPVRHQDAVRRAPVRWSGPVEALHVFLNHQTSHSCVSGLSVYQLPECFHRVRADDLRDAQRQSVALRTHAGNSGCTVFVDVEAIVDHDVRKAIDEADRNPRTPAGEGALRYVGTPRGLAGFIDDLRRLGIADGVTLLPTRFADDPADSINDVLHALVA